MPSRICSPNISNSEIQFLRTIFENLGYPIFLINKVVAATKAKFYNPPPPMDTEEPSNILVLPYNDSLSRFQYIMKSSCNTKLVFRYNNTIGRSLIKNSPVPLVTEGGVYSIPCFECSDKYYGETIKSLNTRISQHKYDVSKYKRCNALYRHMLDKNHSIDWENASFVFNNKNKDVLQMVESALISRLPNFNLAAGFYSLPNNIAQDIVSELRIGQ